MGLDPEQTEDALSEADWALIRAVDNFDPTRGTPFSAFLKRWLRGHFKQFVKNLHDEREVELEEDFDRECPNTRTPHQLLHQQVLMDAVERAMYRLEDWERALILARYHHRMDYRKLALHLCTPGEKVHPSKIQRREQQVLVRLRILVKQELRNG